MAGRQVQQNAGWVFFEAAIMLFVGFYWLRGLTGISPWQLYNFSVAAVLWTFRVGGLLLLVIAMLCWAGWRFASLLDAVVSAAMGLAFLIAGVVWLVASDMMGVLIVFFAAMSLHSARGSWEVHRSIIAMTAGALSSNATGMASGTAVGALPAGQAADPASKEQAMKRLLATKQTAVRDPGAGLEPDPDVPDAELPQQADLGEEESEEQPSAVQADDEPPPDGFLAELGRDDEQDRG